MSKFSRNDSAMAPEWVSEKIQTVKMLHLTFDTTFVKVQRSTKPKASEEAINLTSHATAKSISSNVHQRDFPNKQNLKLETTTSRVLKSMKTWVLSLFLVTLCCEV